MHVIDPYVMVIYKTAQRRAKAHSFSTTSTGVGFGDCWDVDARHGGCTRGGRCSMPCGVGRNARWDMGRPRTTARETRTAVQGSTRHAMHYVLLVGMAYAITQRPCAIDTLLINAPRSW